MISYAGENSYQRIIPLAASAVVVGNGYVCTDTNGNLNAASDTSGFVFCGSSAQDVSNATGAAGAQIAMVNDFSLMPRYQKIATTGLTRAAVGAMSYFTNTAGAASAVGLAASSSNKVSAGRIVDFVSSTFVVIDTWDRFTLATA